VDDSNDEAEADAFPFKRVPSESSFVALADVSEESESESSLMLSCTSPPPSLIAFLIIRRKAVIASRGMLFDPHLEVLKKFLPLADVRSFLPA